MSEIEYAKLLELICTKYKLMSKHGRSIKYVSSHFDTRDNEIYYVSLREWFCKDAVTFTKCDNESLYDRIVKWLEERKC